MEEGGWEEELTSQVPLPPRSIVRVQASRQGDAVGRCAPRGVFAAVHAPDRHAAGVHDDGERGVVVRREERRVRDGSEQADGVDTGF